MNSMCNNITTPQKSRQVYNNNKQKSPMEGDFVSVFLKLDLASVRNGLKCAG